MRKTIRFVIIVIFLLCFSVGQIFAEKIDIESMDKAVINYILMDGTIREETIVNKHNRKFEDAVKKLIEYYYNVYNIKEITSINDIPLKGTQFSNYSGTISLNSKGIGYSSAQDILQRARNNEDNRLTMVYTNTGDIITTKIDNKDVNITVQPYTRDGVTYIQFRPLFEAFGFNVTSDFNDYYQIVSATKKENGENIRIDIKIEDKNAFMSKKGLLTLDAAPMTKDGTACISIKSAEQLLGVEIKFDSKNKKLTIIRK